MAHTALMPWLAILLCMALAWMAPARAQGNDAALPSFAELEAAGARIGEGCSLGQGVYVGNDVVIGRNVKIQNNVSVYDAVTLEDDVFCGPSMVFTNVYNPRSAVPRKNEYRRTLIRRGATVGANATLVCGVTIGRHAFIAAGAVVTRDVPDYALVTGVPGRQRGWMSRHGQRLLPAKGEALLTCPESGLRYALEGGVLRCLDLDEDAPLPDDQREGTIAYRTLRPRETP